MLQERFDDWNNVVYFVDDKTDFGYGGFGEDDYIETDIDSDGNLCVYVDETELPQLSRSFDDEIGYLAQMLENRQGYDGDGDNWFYIVLRDGTLIDSRDIDYDTLEFSGFVRNGKRYYKCNVFNFKDIVGVWTFEVGWQFVAYDTNPNNINLVAEKFGLPLI